MAMEETRSREAHRSPPAGARERQLAVNPWPMESRPPLWAISIILRRPQDGARQGGQE